MRYLLRYNGLKRYSVFSTAVPDKPIKSGLTLEEALWEAKKLARMIGEEVDVDEDRRRVERQRETIKPENQ